MANPREVFHFIQRNSKRVGVSIAGFVVLILGIVLLVAPGPGMLVIILGLAILSTEYAWARRALDQAKARAKGAADRIRRKPKPEPPADEVREAD